MAKKKSEEASIRSYAEIWGPPVLFVSFVLVGCAYIVIAKHFAVRQLLVTFVPVAFMLAYAAVMALSRFLRMRDDQAGDNLYYMGFLFTLTSLGASLYHFNASGNSEYIVQNFGIAIASTITGIAGRVLFNQMRRDPVDVERTARLELADAARRVRTELDQTVLEFNFFRRGAMQSLQEGFDEIGRQVQDVGQKLLKGLEEVTEKSAAPLEAASRSSGATIEGLTRTVVAALEESARKLAEENEKLSGSARAIAGSLDGVKERLAAMQGPDEVIKIKLDPTIKGLASAVDRFTARIDQHEKVFGSALEGVRLYSESSRETAESIRVTAADTGAVLREAMGSLKETISSFETVAKSQSEQVEAVMRRSDDTLSVLRDMSTAATERDAKHMETLREMTAAATERDAKHMETLSKLLPQVGKADNVIELSSVKDTPVSPVETKRGFFSFGSNT